MLPFTTTNSRLRYFLAYNGDDENNETETTPQRRVYPRIFVLTLCVGIVALGGLLLGLSFTTSRVESSSDILFKPCGETPDEAIARGCFFDIISFCWLAPRCYDADLSSQFDQITAWEWYRDFNHTLPVTHEQIMTGRFTGLHVSLEYHLRHCTTTWEKMHRAFLGPNGPKAIDSYIASYEHTKHCTMLLNDESMQLEAVNTMIVIKYPDCGMGWRISSSFTPHNL